MKTDKTNNGLPKDYKIKFSKELKEYLSKKKPEYFVQQAEFWQKELDKIKYYSENYESSSIDEFINIIEPFENINEFFDKLFIVICNRIKNNQTSLQTSLKLIDNLILYYKKPKIPYNKNNKKNTFLLENYEYLKEKIELQFKGIINDQPKGKRTPVPKFENIESIFHKSGNLQKVIDCLISYETLNENGELIKKAYHVSAISEALKIKGIINKKVSMTQRNKLFAEKFCIDVSDRTARAENREHETLLTEYKELFDTVKFL